MSLPTISTLNTTQDTNKQLAQIRSYLIQLKDELEAELSNVTYDMLSASLQKKIDAISEDIAYQNSQNDINAQMITANYAKVGSLVADAITTSELYADNVSAQAITTANLHADTVGTNTLNASKVYADTVSASAITTANLHADQVSANALSVANANIATLDTKIVNAGYVNATQVNAQIASFGYVNATEVNSIIGNYHFITASYINATNICGALTDVSQGLITIGTVRAQNYYYFTGNEYKAVTGVASTTQGGVVYRLMGYRV